MLVYGKWRWQLWRKGLPASAGCWPFTSGWAEGSEFFLLKREGSLSSLSLFLLSLILKIRYFLPELPGTVDQGVKFAFSYQFCIDQFRANTDGATASRQEIGDGFEVY